MATETVSAFTPVSLNFNNGYKKRENDYADHTSTVIINNSPITQSYYERMPDMSGRELPAPLREHREQTHAKQRKDELNNRQEKVNIESVKQESFQDEKRSTLNGDPLPSNGEKQEEDPSSGKKKRNPKKRNRSDMPPEELMRLRERERKAQQSRRDRIRAQKRHAQGWHDDDAAWEAFLDQAENNNDAHEDLKPNFASSLPPSMVCPMPPRDSPKDEMFASDISSVDLRMNGSDVKEIIKEEEEEEVDHLVNGAHDMKKVIQKQDSVHSNDTDTNSAGSYLDNQSVHYSSDDKPMDSQLNEDPKENGKKKLSRRHYLPSDELERLRKRERETKRRQRERHRLANTESASPVKSNSTLSSNDTEYIEDMINEADMKPTDTHKFKSIDQGHTPPPENSVIPLVVPPNPILTSSESHLADVTPHSHHIVSNHHRHYPSLVYMPNSTRHQHHHYSQHSPTQYLREGQHHPDSHYPRYVLDDRHYHSEQYKVDGHLPHVIPISHRTPSSVDGMSSPDRKSKLPASTSPINGSNEKKKMISRNVDRKSLSEEELEELRRRERDYQRERRARIRLEKAKSQANHEQYSQKPREDGVPHYYHTSQVYHPHSSLHMYHDDLHHRDRDKPIHVIPNCETDDRFDYRQYSPHYISKSTHERKDSGINISITDSRNEKHTLSSSDDGKENELLQVVPKTRECEEMSTSPPQVTPNKHVSPDIERDETIENVSNTIKKETDSDEWNENPNSLYGDNDDNDDSDDKLVIVHPNTCQEKEVENKCNGDSPACPSVSKEDLINGSSTHSITSVKSSDEMSLRDRIMEDQLERRRRSNREAQRRRRARLKIQESSEDRPDSADEILDYELVRGSKLHYSDEKLSSHVIPKGCRMKVTPSLRQDSHYSGDYHSYHNHHNGKLSYSHAYERYGRHGHGHGHSHLPSTHQVEKHCYYSSHRSSKEIDSHRYPHYFREQSKIERYMHDLPAYHDHHGNSLHVHEYNDQNKCSRVPSVEKYDHPNEVLEREPDEKMEKPPLSSSSPSTLCTPKVENDVDMEPSKQCGRKRKQYAPRKVIASSNTPEEDIDVCTVGECPEEKSIYKDAPSDECTSKKILQFNGDDNYENISSQENFDDLNYLYR